jgi:hypothetical protein
MTTLTVDELANRIVDRSRARWKTLLVFALVGGAAAVAGSFLIRPMYESEAAFQAETQSCPGPWPDSPHNWATFPWGAGGR